MSNTNYFDGQSYRKVMKAEIKLSKCTCECHQPGSGVLHFYACCRNGYNYGRVYLDRPIEYKHSIRPTLKREGEIVASYEIDRVNLVAMTLERDELDEKYKEAVRDRKEYKKLYDLQVKKNIQDIEAGNKIMEDYKAAQDKLLYISQVVKKNEEYIKVLETKIQFLEPYKDLYEEYKARYEFEENPPEVEEIFVTSSCPEDVYAAFIDKDRAQWDAKESGTELCSIKLYRGPKAIFNDNEKDY